MFEFKKRTLVTDFQGLTSFISGSVKHYFVNLGLQPFQQLQAEGDQGKGISAQHPAGLNAGNPFTQNLPLCCAVPRACAALLKA